LSWSARIAHTSTGLAIVFAGPVSRLDFTPDVADHFARLLAAEARTAGLGSTLEISRSETTKTQESVVFQHPLCCDCDSCLNGGAH
jgi:hypothetical protein